VLTAGRLKRYKNHALVIESMVYLDSTFQLHIAGGGRERSSLAALIRRLGLEARVSLLGPIDTATLYRWYRTADVYVTMSEQEAFGITILEAMAGGARIVAADIPSHRELAVLTNATAMTLVAAGTTAASLATHIARSAEGKRVPDTGIRLPSWDSVAQRTEEVYNEVLGWGTYEPMR
jgi:glycosyltransferase involved in cell wall biosynthesis